MLDLQTGTCHKVEKAICEKSTYADPSDDSKTCLPCADECIECTEKANLCTVCASEFVLQDQTCIDPCLDEGFLSFEGQDEESCKNRLVSGKSSEN